MTPTYGCFFLTISRKTARSAGLLPGSKPMAFSAETSAWRRASILSRSPGVFATT